MQVIVVYVERKIVRVRTFYFDNTLRTEMTSAFQREQQRVLDFLASVETDREINDSGVSGKYHIPESEHDTNSEI